jgi:ribosomal protein S18 acetylase RimI-like enzyme
VGAATVFLFYRLVVLQTFLLWQVWFLALRRRAGAIDRLRRSFIVHADTLILFGDVATGLSLQPPVIPEGVRVMEVTSTPLVTTVTPAEVERAVAVIVLAFGADPVARWQYGDDAEQYLMHFPPFVRAFGGMAFALGTAQHVDCYAGVALWLPPDIHPDEEAIAASVPAERREQVGALVEKIASYHPREPHWYLPLIGVDPARRNKGHGSALMEAALRRFDQDHVAAYLESTNPENIALYQKHGFELLGSVRVGSSPPLFPMLRAAQ